MSTGTVAFFRARGLSVAQEIVRSRVEVKTAGAVFEPLYRRLGKGPADPDARIVTADQGDARAVAAFVVRAVDGYPEEIAARLNGRGRTYCPQTAMVALADDRIVGVQLTLTRGREMAVESKAVEVAHRRTRHGQARPAGGGDPGRAAAMLGRTTPRGCRVTPALKPEPAVATGQ